MPIDYSRNYLYVSEESQEQIAHDYTILIIGAGLGSFIAEGLLRLGFIKIIIADGDVVEPSNLNRQNYTADDKNEVKSIALAKRLNKIVHDNCITYIPFHLSDHDTLERWIKQADIVINTIDLDSPAFLECNKIARAKGKVTLFPLNLGFAGSLYVFYPKTISFEEYFDSESSSDMKMNIVNHTIRMLNRNQKMPVWLLEAIMNYRTEKPKEYDPQMVPASLNIASLVTSCCYAVTQQERLKEFPYLIFQDSYQTSLVAGYDLKERGKEKSICLYHMNLKFSVWELGRDRLQDFVDCVWKVYENTFEGEWPYTEKDKQKMYEEEVYYHPASRIFAVLDQNKEIVGTSRVICSNLQDHYVLPITKEFDISKKEIYERFQVKPDEGDIYDVGRSAIDKEKLIEHKERRALSMSMFEHLAKQYYLDVSYTMKNIIVAEPTQTFYRINQRIGFCQEILGESKKYFGIKCLPVGILMGIVHNNLKENFLAHSKFFQ